MSMSSVVPVVQIYKHLFCIKLKVVARILKGGKFTVLGSSTGCVLSPVPSTKPQFERDSKSSRNKLVSNLFPCPLSLCLSFESATKCYFLARLWRF